MTAPTQEVPPQWTAYIDLAMDMKPFLQIPAENTQYDVILQEYIDAACWWTQSTMKKPIALTEFFRRFNGYSGWGGDTIVLPFAPVVVDASHPITVVEYWGASGAHTLTQQTPENQGGSDMFTLDNIEGLVIRSYLGLLRRPSFPGLKNIEVTWWAGRNPVPRHWLTATKKLVKWWFSNEQEASRSGFKPAQGLAGAYDMSGHLDASFGIPPDIAAIFAPEAEVGIG